MGPGLFYLDEWSGVWSYWDEDRFVSLRVSAFCGAYGEPPRACGVSPCPLFPSESAALCCTSLFGEEEFWYSPSMKIKEFAYSVENYSYIPYRKD
ncbi:hypothetical protein ANABIO32_32070 [Rossellomorea marisflavi]|uniref:hypothetical protein n=1 Tax=Rossellomorea marisflavi TaxID=189381 RepID=UPI0025C9260D|nr:hypothetical protein [Rossellomorea marisflavi]GLI85471.1 hypothetical protein ANABIO32_32070 [Rossellomorea marisflavi]